MDNAPDAFKMKPFNLNVKVGSDSSESESESDDELILPVIPQVAKKFEPQVLTQPSPQLDISDMNKPAMSHKRFSIWTDVLMEQNLTEAMHADMRFSKGKHANRIHRHVDEPGRKADGPKNRTTRGWLDEKLHKRGQSSKSKEHSVDKELSAAEICKRRKRNQKKRNRKHRTDDEKVTLDIATKLKEPKIDLVRKAVAMIGLDAAKRICGEAMTVEEAGGMMTLKGNRRRSPGGVFFSLIKNDKSISDKQKNDLFFVDPAKLEARKNLSKKARHKLRKTQAIIKKDTNNTASFLETLTLDSASTPLIKPAKLDLNVGSQIVKVD